MVDGMVGSPGWCVCSRVGKGKDDLVHFRFLLGPLPLGARGMEFYTDTPHDAGCPPRVACWRGPRPGVRVEGSFANIRDVITRNTQGWVEA